MACFYLAVVAAMAIGLTGAISAGKAWEKLLVILQVVFPSFRDECYADGDGPGKAGT